MDCSDRLLTGVVAALRPEARTLGPSRRRGDGLSILPDGTLIVVSGMGRTAAAAGARTLVDAGATALVSWGMAGGLDPMLTAGTICLPRTVISPDGVSFATDHCWGERVAGAIAARRDTPSTAPCTTVSGALLTSASAIDDVPGKAAAFRVTGAVAVDMESAAVADVAASHGLPFIAVRVIVDTAVDALPPSVLGASTGGQVRLPRLVLGLIRSPLDIAPLIRLARRYRAARGALMAIAGTHALAPPGGAATCGAALAAARTA